MRGHNIWPEKCHANNVNHVKQNEQQAWNQRAGEQVANRDCFRREDPHLELRPADIRQLRRAIVGYLAAPGYSDMIEQAGFEELVNYARTRPHPKKLLAAIPDSLVSAIGLVGSRTQIAQRLAAYRSAGADEICLVPATAADAGGLGSLEAMREMW